MIKEDLIPLDSPAMWKQALDGIKHSFGHTWENCYAMQLTTGFKTYLYCFESEHGRVVCPIAERDYRGLHRHSETLGLFWFRWYRQCSRFFALLEEVRKRREDTFVGISA